MDAKELIKRYEAGQTKFSGVNLSGLNLVGADLIGIVIYTVSCFTQNPLINGDNNNQITAGAPITGTALSPAGTVIRVYSPVTTLVATTAVQANGTWSTGNAGTTPAIFNAVAGTSYYANAQNGTCGLSANSSNYTAIGATLASRCGTIIGPVSASAPSISGNVT